MITDSSKDNLDYKSHFLPIKCYTISISDLEIVLTNYLGRKIVLEEYHFTDDQIFETVLSFTHQFDIDMIKDILSGENSEPVDADDTMLVLSTMAQEELIPHGFYLFK